MLKRIWVSCLLLAASPVYAVDGLLEVNHTSIMASGGYPWRPTAGSYRLTSDLIAGSAAGIEPDEDDVTVDFNGFSLIGDGSAVDGIDGTQSPDGHTFRNGTIRGFGGRAIANVSTCRVEEMWIRNNAGGGLDVGSPCVVRANIIQGNGGTGGLVGQGTGVVYSENVFSGNPGGHVSGARSFKQNLCDGSSCESEGRRFYLTQSDYDGAGASGPAVCDEGFHFASLWEIKETSHLRYDIARGRTTPDSGEGPPRFPIGWVRTGGNAFFGDQIPGTANCGAYTVSDSASEGTVIFLSEDWAGLGVTTPFGSWRSGTRPCSATEAVWCVEDD